MPGGRWLDAGCGAGTYTRILLDARQDVVGVDYSSVTLRKAATRNLKGASFVAADVRFLPFRAGTFEGALCLGVTQALAESGGAIRSLGATLKPGGDVWLDALNGWCVIHVWGRLRRRMRGKPRHLRYESPWRMKRLLRECGFDDVQLHWMPIAPGGSPALQRVAESPVTTWLLRWIPLAGPLLSHAFILQGHQAPLMRRSTWIDVPGEPELQHDEDPHHRSVVPGVFPDPAADEVVEKVGPDDAALAETVQCVARE